MHNVAPFIIFILVVVLSSDLKVSHHGRFNVLNVVVNIDFNNIKIL